MDDDDEKRFPRISLWQFLSGIFLLIVRFYAWPLDDFERRGKRKEDR